MVIAVCSTNLVLQPGLAGSMDIRIGKRVSWSGEIDYCSSETCLPLSRLGNEWSAKKHVVRVVLLWLPEPGAGHLALTL